MAVRHARRSRGGPQLALFGRRTGEGSLSDQGIASPRPSLPGDGPEVSVRGSVIRVLAPRLLEMGGTGGDPILVLVVHGATSVVAGTRAEVTGPVRPFVVGQLDADFGLHLSGRGLEALEGSRVVSARLVGLSPRSMLPQREPELLS